jgi:hypothetical protein
MFQKIKDLMAGAGDALGVEIPTDFGAVSDAVTPFTDVSGVTDAVSGVTDAVSGVTDAVSGVTDNGIATQRSAP